MKLIDADELIKYIKIWEIGTSISSDQKEFIDCVNKQPTVFDVGKVVEQLEERTTFLKECTKYGNKDAEQQEKSYATMMMYEVAYLVDDLLEIVKGGGVE